MYKFLVYKLDWFWPLYFPLAFCSKNFYSFAVVKKDVQEKNGHYYYISISIMYLNISYSEQD